MYKTAILYDLNWLQMENPLRGQNHLFKSHALLNHNREHRGKAVCLQVLIQKVDSKVHNFLVRQEHSRARNLKKKKKAIRDCFCAARLFILTSHSSEVTPSLSPSPALPSFSILPPLLKLALPVPSHVSARCHNHALRLLGPPSGMAVRKRKKLTGREACLRSGRVPGTGRPP